MLALAEIDDGGSRTDAARIGSVGLQTVCDLVLTFDAQWADGLIDDKAVRASLQSIHRWGDRPHVSGMRRYELTDAHWEQIASLLPPQKPRKGRPAEDYRQILNGMLWILGTGAPWADLPTRYGAVGTVLSRFYRWRQAGVFDRVLRCLQAPADARGNLDWDLHFVDATVVRAHLHAGPAPSGVRVRSRGLVRRTGAVRAGSRLSDNCAPMAAVLTAGERNEQFAAGCADGQGDSAMPRAGSAVSAAT